MSGRINPTVCTSTSRQPSPPRRSPSPPIEDDVRTLDRDEYIRITNRNGEPRYIITNPKQPIVCPSPSGPVGEAQ